jgi:hypothetical protein
LGIPYSAAARNFGFRKSFSKRLKVTQTPGNIGEMMTCFGEAVEINKIGVVNEKILLFIHQ